MALLTPILVGESRESNSSFLLNQGLPLLSELLKLRDGNQISMLLFCFQEAGFFFLAPRNKNTCAILPSFPPSPPRLQFHHLPAAFQMLSRTKWRQFNLETRRTRRRRRRNKRKRFHSIGNTTKNLSKIFFLIR